MSRPTSRIATTSGLAAAAVLASSIVALAAGSGTVDPPPRIAFVARSDNPADALAVGPTAGQLGAPVFVTASTSLVPATADGLKAYAPELVIIAGGDAAITAQVEAAIEAVTGLPDGKVVRAAGKDRHETAVAIADLLAAHNPAFLPVDATATDADLLDGKDSSAFLGKTEKAADAAHADNADALDGTDSTAFLRGDGSTALTGDLTYATPQTRELYVSGLELNSQTGGLMTQLPTFTSGEVGSGDALLAPIHLPAGATITGLDFRLNDSDASINLIASVRVADRMGNSTSNVGFVLTSGSSGVQVLSDNTIDPVYDVVDPDAYQYYLSVDPASNANWPSGTLSFQWLKVTYTTTSLH